MNRIPYRSQIDFNFSLKFWFLPLNKLLLSIIDILILFNPSLIFRHSTIIDLIQYSNYTKLSPQSQAIEQRERKERIRIGENERRLKRRGKGRGEKLYFEITDATKGIVPRLCVRDRGFREQEGCYVKLVASN